MPTASGESPFFSIVVPAHNEALYIEETLGYLAALAYPRDRFEVIVAENGSTDGTYEAARSTAAQANQSVSAAQLSSSDLIRVISCTEKGVAHARNRGMDEAHLAAAWIIFLDADAHLAPSFLNELAAFLGAPHRANCVIGTTRLQPFPATPIARAWFRFYDGVHAILKNSASIIIARADIARAIRFDENLSLMEDLAFTRTARQRGSFFFLPTPSVTASTRRFVRDGWLQLFMLFLFVGMLPARFARRFTYDAVR